MSSSPNTYYIKELNPEFIAPSTKQMMDGESHGSKIVVIGKPGCFTAGTKVLMYDGTSKNVEDVKILDQVMGDDSTPRTVLKLCHNVDEMYKIIPNKGEPYTVNKQHKLVLMSSGYNKHKKGEIIEISVEDYLNEKQTFHNRMKIFRAGVEFPFQKVDIDPYFLGLWLGDGTSSNCNITNIDTEVINYLSKYCKENNFELQNLRKYTYSITSFEKTKGKNKLLNALNKYNIRNNKHIPLEYKANSREVRLQLLAGLIDTDGSYDKNGCFDFIQKNEKLFDDVLWLARSLGFSANKKECRKSCMYKGEKKEGTYFRCCISGNTDEIPCKIKRKQATKRIMNKNNLVTGFKIESQGEGEYFGFTLDGNHRFLLNSFDVVRNSGKSSVILSLLYAKRHIFPVGVAFSGTEDSNGTFSKIMPKSFVFNAYSEDQIKSFIRRQKIAKMHLPNPWAVMILDDCTDDIRIFKSPLQHGIFKKGRHWNMLYLLSLQYCNDILPVIRTNIDGVFILRETIIKNRKALYENYAGIIPDFSLFCDLLDQLTEDYHCLYISNQMQSSDWKDCVFWYKATPVPDNWKFGCEEYWKFDEERYNPSYVDHSFDV